MDVGRPPLARFPAGDVRLSETLITYADLDEAIAKVPAGCACTSGAVDFYDMPYHSPSHLQTCPTALDVGVQYTLNGPERMLQALPLWQHACMSLSIINKVLYACADMGLLSACRPRSKTLQACL